MEEKLEKRIVSQIEDKELSTRALTNEAGQKEIIGYAMLFNSESRLLFDFIDGEPRQFYETIDARALENVIMQDVIYDIDHNPNRLIARQTAGNLELTITEKGLMFRAVLPNTTEANDLWENVRVGNYQENSFMFKVRTDQKKIGPDGILRRHILSISEIRDVSTVLQGAYQDTVVASRAVEETKEFEKEIEKANNSDLARIVEAIDIEFQFRKAKFRTFEK